MLKDESNLFEKEYEITKKEMKSYYLKLIKIIKSCKPIKRKIKKNLVLTRNDVLIFQFQKELEVYFEDFKVSPDKIKPENVNFNYYSLETCIYIMKSLEDFIKEILKK